MRFPTQQYHRVERERETKQPGHSWHQHELRASGIGDPIINYLIEKLSSRPFFEGGGRDQESTGAENCYLVPVVVVVFVVFVLLLLLLL